MLLTRRPFDAEGYCRGAGLPAPALHLTQDDIPNRKPRGNKAWLETAARKLGLRTNQLLMVGASEYDWYTSLHAGVMHLHAKWPKSLRKPITSLTATGPAGVRRLMEHCLLEAPTWALRIDDPARSFRMRSLLAPNATLPGRCATRMGSSFTLQDIFTRGLTVQVGKDDARELLMLRLLSSAYLDGTLPGSTLFCVYPSSSPGKVSQQLETYLAKAKVIVGAKYTQDHLLQRVAQAPDTSLERWRASQQGRTANVSITTQASTVRVNPSYRGKLRGKTVIVFDDFTTTGMSLEWARLLLTAASAAEVIALTVGKYPKPHTFYTPRPGVTLRPYELNTLTAADFTTTPVSPGHGPGPAESLHRAFEQLISADKAK